jgi:hypothetical protein
MTPVPELAAKKAKREEAWATQKAADALEARKKAKETRRVIFKKAAQYVSEFRQQVSLAKRCDAVASCAARVARSRSAQARAVQRGGGAACALRRTRGE